MAVNKAYTSMLPTASDLEGALFNVSVPNADSDTGYESKKASIEEVGSNIVNDIEWQTDLTETTEKTVSGAINEIAGEVADLKDLEGSASGDMATFVDGSANPLKELVISIEAVQSGSGDPSPTNIRPISGWTGANIHVADGADPHVIDNVYPISWQTEAVTVYGGTLDVKTGVLTVTHARYTITESTIFGSFTESAQYGSWAQVANITGQKIGDDKILCISDMAVGVSYNNRIASPNKQRVYSDGLTNKIIIRASASDNITTENDLKTLFMGANIIYELDTPVTYQLTPTEVRSLLGINNVWADCGAITVLKYTRDLNLALQNRVLYSRDKRKVGTWLDGRGIYEEVIEFTNTTASFSDFIDIVTMPDLDFPLKIEWCASRRASKNFYYTGNGAAITESSSTYYILTRLMEQTLQYRIGGYGTQIGKMIFMITYVERGGAE